MSYAGIGLGLILLVSCGILGGLECVDCTGQQSVGGNASTIYVGVLTELDPINPYDTDADGRITAINFLPYKGLYKFCAKNRSVTTNQAGTKGDNGLSYYAQTVEGRFQHQGQVSKNVLDSLKNIENAFIVVEDNNHQIALFGKEFGLSTTITKPSGANIGDDNTYLVSAASIDGSGERNLAPDVFVTDYQTTKELLESYTL